MRITHCGNDCLPVHLYAVILRLLGVYIYMQAAVIAPLISQWLRKVRASPFLTLLCCKTH